MSELRTLSLDEAFDLHEVMQVRYENERRQHHAMEVKRRREARRRGRR